MCAKCGSLDIRTVYPKIDDAMMIGHVCIKCGSSIIVDVNKKDVKKFKEK